MRTTVNLPDDVYAAARSVAMVKDISLGEAIADLVRQGLRPPLSIETENGLLAPFLPKDSPIVTLEHTLAIEDEIPEEEG
ncbi:MAG TPA: hypothetical protein VK752_27360 [Bryobacteraceae bacterium]|jgi:hypothetical protein|nr:hypothetical protein [Bryobacteraceae bacterium]